MKPYAILAALANAIICTTAFILLSYRMRGELFWLQGTVAFLGIFAISWMLARRHL